MRRKDREIKKTDEILRIAESAKILHLGLSDDDFPYVVPLHYGFEYTDKALVFYTHGAAEGHKIDLIRADGRVCVELECGVEAVSGGEIPCAYGSLFASVIGRGYAEIVKDTAEKIHGLSVLMKTQTGRDFEIGEKAAASVCVIKITVADFTAKARTA